LKKNRKREYKYLIVGFVALFLRQTIISIILFINIFSNNRFTRFKVVIGFMDGYLETVALLLLVSAFLFPVFKKTTFLFQKRIIYSLFMVTGITLVTYVLFKNGQLQDIYALAIPEILQIFILITPFYVLSRSEYKKIRFKGSILLAFLSTCSYL